MKRLQQVALVSTLLSLLAGAGWLAVHYHKPIRQKTIATDLFGTLSVAYPLLGVDQQVLAFVDTRKIPPQELAERIAGLGALAVIVDAERTIQSALTGTNHCLAPKQIAASIHALATKIPLVDEKPLVISGIDDGALIPFLNAQAPIDRNRTNLSVGFTAVLPPNLSLCPPFLIRKQGQQHILAPSPGLTGNSWRSVWNDQPEVETADFVQGIPKTKTWIALYDTPVETVLISELQKLFFHTDGPPGAMPIVEIPAANDNETVTLFYSGDGGWRDLDRVVGEAMAKQGWPVVGIDCLRGFWSSKTPEQSTVDLAGAMAYYRQNWGAKYFVLAGYSFGADILPPIYNRLSPADQESVRLLVLLTPSSQIDFAIHISEWLGKKSKAFPMAPEMMRLPPDKILCIYGQEEKSETACSYLAHTRASILELPGGHHFDKDYEKLTRLILEHYPQQDAQGGKPSAHRQ
ncbi:virulence factor family protein [Desulfopila sp. IMCC35006]|uniref:virulence factor family protein n=1 Tax=Desulfopila sp. IMCC35006 TaxID=2569542 RepID=UPI0010AD1082|nr:AcvB/VirJ family lysyl-phosphatidylglycerol hydrolase [Desulfopila sp. IMCC35006]TKB28608.1 virulence factor family protein [Desulfopila sp. IMCC35006]